MTQEGKRRWALAAIFVIVAALAAFWFLYKDEQQLELTFLDVGQGDAALIETPHHAVILVDAGPDSGVMRRLGEELPFWEKTIDLAIITHPHADHYRGFVQLLNRYTVRQFMISDYQSSSAEYSDLLKTISEKNIPIIRPSATQFTIDGVSFDVLFPQMSLLNAKIKNANNASIVFKMSYGSIDVLWTGDAEAELEKQLLSYDLASELLKLGHHGSDTSSSDVFLDKVKPLYAVASVGQGNSFGHPSLLILKRLERRGIQLFRTDTEGSIRLQSDGTRLFHEKTCLIGCSSL